MKTEDLSEKTSLRGYLTIHVAGYKINSSHSFHIFMSGDENVCVPDRLIKAELHPVGSMTWLEEGWAVGDNPRERFCRWNWVKGMRKFLDFDEAVAYIYHLRQKRKTKQEKYTLVYFLKDCRGKDVFQPVSSLADIAQFEIEIDAEIQKYQEEAAARNKSMNEDYPELDILRKSFGNSKAFTLSEMLKRIRTHGKAKVMQEMPLSSFYRYSKELRKLGLLED